MWPGVGDHTYNVSSSETHKSGVTIELTLTVRAVTGMLCVPYRWITREAAAY